MITMNTANSTRIQQIATATIALLLINVNFSIKFYRSMVFINIRAHFLLAATVESIHLQAIDRR